MIIDKSTKVPSVGGTFTFLRFSINWISTAVYAAKCSVGRKEFIHREFNAAEELAGIVITAAYALFFRYTVIIGRNKQL